MFIPLPDLMMHLDASDFWVISKIFPYIGDVSAVKKRKDYTDYVCVG
jgi:hypothetical protein